MAPPGMKWKPISIHTRLTFSGGFQNKSFALETSEIDIQGKIESFVKIDKNAEWLLKASLGPTAQRGALKRSQVIEEMKAKLCQKISIPAVADASLDAVADPMDALDDVSILETPKKRKYVKKRQSGLVQSVEMSLLAPSAHPNSTQKYTVQCLPKGSNGLDSPS